MAEKRQPERRCAGCMKSFPQGSLIRITAGDDGLVIGDRKAPGRGVYLCPDPACARLAEKKNAIARGLKKQVSKDQMTLLITKIEEISQNKTHGGDAYAK